MLLLFNLHFESNKEESIAPFHVFHLLLLNWIENTLIAYRIGNRSGTLAHLVNDEDRESNQPYSQSWNYHEGHYGKVSPFVAFDGRQSS